jgi:diaminopimelate epimerase
MLVHFSKYHGTGNDFLMIDGREQECSIFTPEVVAHLCHRRFGVGSDGLIILDKSDSSDFYMNYYNADGRKGSMCGNGGRCIAAFAKDLGLVKDQCSFEGIDGMHSASFLSDGMVCLKLQDVDGIRPFDEGFLADTGSPHFVQFVENLDGLDVENEGRRIRHEERFGTEGVNVNFVQHGAAPGQLTVRTFERGVEAETWSCGTGVTASAICAHHHLKHDNISYEIETKGGKLGVKFGEENPGSYREIYLTGPALHVYDGSIDIVV